MKLYHGAAFYPELWSKETIIEDIKKMKQIGINIVRIGEFWWSKIEPEEDKYKFEFVIDILDLLYKNKIDVIMCTPTATPPIWLTHNRDNILHVNENGVKMYHGSRQHVCTNNSYFINKIEKMLMALCSKIGSHPAIVLWQIDNELKCHVSECFCETCKGIWHKWLEKNIKQ